MTKYQSSGAGGHSSIKLVKQSKNYKPNIFRGNRKDTLEIGNFEDTYGAAATTKILGGDIWGKSGTLDENTPMPSTGQPVLGEMGGTVKEQFNLKN